LSFRGIEVEFLAPNQLRFLALPHNLVKEAAEDVETVTGADLAQTGVIGQSFS
jgi:hypothetical protein